MPKAESQSDKFKKTAKALGVDLDEDKLKDALRKIAKAPEKDEKPEK